MSNYWKNRDVHLKAQKKYDDKNREKKHQYDKLRWQKRKLEHQALLDIKQYIKEKRKSGEIFYINEVEKIVNEALGDKENE